MRLSIKLRTFRPDNSKCIVDMSDGELDSLINHALSLETQVEQLVAQTTKQSEKLNRIAALLEQAQSLPYSASINNGVIAILNEPNY